ncbi:MAG: hypothetical protein FWD55_09185 [Propionibacteriaceae bacterium]|nr:hypothetical protein [Propionibacteriaceae bacterium]
MTKLDSISRWRRTRPWWGVYAGTVAVVAVVSGIIWNRTVVLPAYEIGEDFRARIPESGLAQLVSIDVVYSLIAVVGGLIVGITSWVLFKRLGWLVTLIAVLGALIAGIGTRIVGEIIGPRSFEDRIAAATRGELVRVDFAAHTWVPLAIWVAMAVLPIMLASMVRREKWINYVPATPTEATPD